MKFFIEIRSKGYKNPLILGSVPIGLSRLDEAKRAIPSLNTEDDLLSCIERKIESCFDVTVPVEVAQKTGLFAATNCVQIEVSEKFLNQFAEVVLEVWRINVDENEDENGSKIDTKSYKDGDTVQFSWQVNSARLLEAWLKSGFPKKWESEDES